MFRASYINLIIYGLVCFSGYITYGQSVSEFIPYTYTIDNSSLFMLICQFGVALGLTLNAGVSIITIKHAIYPSLAANIDSNSSKIKNPLVSLISMTVGFAFSLFVFEEITPVISFFSSILIPVYVVYIPGKLKSNFKSQINKRECNSKIRKADDLDIFINNGAFDSLRIDT